MNIGAVVIGVSAGGLAALDQILPCLRPDFAVPVVVVQHLAPDSDDFLPKRFQSRCANPVKEVEDKDVLEPGTIYFAPPNYHVLVERNKTLALSVDPRVHFSRPSIDVLFETAAEAYLDKLIGIILTGANEDGANGLAAVKEYGGTTIVQDPETAEVAIMPKAALEKTKVDYVIPLNEIAALVNALVSGKNS